MSDYLNKMGIVFPEEWVCGSNIYELTVQRGPQPTKLPSPNSIADHTISRNSSMLDAGINLDSSIGGVFIGGLFSAL